jgi:hypothetical protein
MKKAYCPDNHKQLAFASAGPSSHYCEVLISRYGKYFRVHLVESVAKVRGSGNEPEIECREVVNRMTAFNDDLYMACISDMCRQAIELASQAGFARVYVVQAVSIAQDTAMLEIEKFVR